MDRERLGRLLSAALVPLGAALLLLNVATGDVVGASLGAVTIVVGAAFVRIATRYPSAEFDLSEAPAFTVNLVQLGGVLVVFALLTYVLGDSESITRVFRAGTASSTPLTYAGLSMGVLLGGGVPYAMHQLGAFGKAMSESVPARMIGFSITFGTFVLLLRYYPPSSLLYAAAYCLGRLVVLVGAYAVSRR